MNDTNALVGRGLFPIVRISLEFATRCGPRAAIELAIARLHFYTEQFWAGSKVGRVVARLDVGALGVPASDFVPVGQYLRHSASPTAIGADALTWRFQDYRQKDYYGRGLVHPLAVNQDRILDRYLRGVGSSSADTRVGRILNADSILSASGHSAVSAASMGREPGAHRVSWNGMDYLRHPVAPGSYRFRLGVDGRWVGDRDIRVLR